MSDNKKILLFTDWYEPGFKAGGPIQSCKNIVNTLAGDYDFFIFTSDRDLGDTAPYSGIKTDQWIKLPNGAQVWYASPSFLKSSNIRKIISNVQPDMVYLNSMFSPGFSLLPLWILRSMHFSGRIILAPRGMLNTSAVSRKKWKKKIFLSLFSLSRMARKIVFHATDNQEKTDIQRYFKNTAQVYLIENIPNANTLWTARPKKRGDIKCVFVSRIHPIKNLLYAINVVKSLAGCTVQFDVYGAIEDDKYFQKCRESVSRANPHIQVNFKGPVANTHLFKVLEEYHLMFLPTQGENFGHVIFEALSCGCIVLISDKTPWSDVNESNAGWALPLTDNRNFAKKIKEVCDMDIAEFSEKSKAAFSYAKAYLGSMNLKGKYSSLFQTTE
ncbi:MAG: glycosyltransferase [Chitinophagaceae bacterium]|nr:glycosyltransferase [Chitinophagaceae bacterium]